MKLQGIVLAGGRSLRFGEDKALAKFGSETFLERSIDLLSRFKLNPCVITNASRDYSFLKCRIERDILPCKGPMGGLYTACRLFPDDSLVVLTCDMPMMSVEALAFLIQSWDSEVHITLFDSCPFEEFYPFPGIYKAHLAESILELIQSDALSVNRLIKMLPSRRVRRITQKFDKRIFGNINKKSHLSNLKLFEI